MNSEKPPTFLDSPRDIGKRIRTLRKERKMTAKQLATLCDISGAYLSNIENGFRPLTYHNAGKVADALSISVEEIGPTTHDVFDAISDSCNVDTHPHQAPTGAVVFQYNSSNVRTIDIAGKRWAVAADICYILELDQVSRALSRIEPQDVLVISRSEAGTSNTPFWKQVDPRVNSISLVSEDGATDLVLDSRKPEARAFRRWLTHEVFPSIRDTGQYIHGDRDELDVLKDTIEALIVTRRTAAEAKALAENTAARLDAIEGHHGWYAALGYLKIKGIDMNTNHLQLLGRHAASIGRENGIAPGKVESFMFGTVNSFPEWVWDEAVIRLNTQSVEK